MSRKRDVPARFDNGMFYLLFVLALALSWFFHRDATRFDDPRELWSDRAGYYIYLPAAFFYGFDAGRMPPDLDVRTGGGFSLDTARHRIDTKYTCGVAMMQAPFFATAYAVSLVAGIDPENGFSMLFMRMNALAAVVYLVAGLWLLKRFLDRYAGFIAVRVTVLLLFAGTNLFYYGLIDGMMSHVYSFFLFAWFLFSLGRYREETSVARFFPLVMAFFLAVLIRPTNALVGLAWVFWDSTGPGEWRDRIRLLVQPSRLALLVLVAALVFFPQMVYWKYLSGQWFHFSYGSEGFANWRSPRIAEVLFSPLNGLFTTNPLVLAFPAGILFMIIRKQRNGWFLATLFMLVTLVYASWGMWYFGCSYGQRSFIEYYAILAVPLALVTDRILALRWLWLRSAAIFLLLFFVYANLRNITALYRFERCWFGSTWDWEHYLLQYRRSGVFPATVSFGQSCFENDFENMAIFPGTRPSKVFTRSGQFSVAVRPGDTLTLLYSVPIRQFGFPPPKQAEVTLWLYNPANRPAGSFLSFTMTRGGMVVFRSDIPADPAPAAWTELRHTFPVADVLDSTLVLNLQIANPGRALLFCDDLRVQFRNHWN